MHSLSLSIYTHSLSLSYPNTTTILHVSKFLRHCKCIVVAAHRKHLRLVLFFRGWFCCSYLSRNLSVILIRFCVVSRVLRLQWMELDVCMNGACKNGYAREWKKGWPLRSGGFARLCDKCG